MKKQNLITYEHHRAKRRRKVRKELIDSMWARFRRRWNVDTLSPRPARDRDGQS